AGAPGDDGGRRERRHVAAHVVETCAVGSAKAVRVRRVRVAAPAPAPQRPGDYAGVVADAFFGFPVLDELSRRVLQAVGALGESTGIAGTAEGLDRGWDGLLVAGLVRAPLGHGQRWARRSVGHQ